MAASDYNSLREQLDMKSWVFEIAERRMLALFCLTSFLLHLALVFWFSSRTPDLQRLDNDDFEVGLVSSEGLGDALQASLPNALEAAAVTPDLINPSADAIETATDDTAADVLPPLQDAEAVSPVLDASPAPETATPVISPLLESAVPALPEPEIDTARSVSPIDAVPSVALADQIQAEASAPETVIESEVVSTIQAVPDVAPMDDFFQPAEILAPGDPITTLPIENVNEITEPEIVLVDVDPELVKQDVEILEIKAREVFPAAPRQQTARPQATTTQATSAQGQGENPNTPNQAGRQSGEIASNENAPQARSQAPAPAIPKTYMLELRQWLSHFKEYPLQAYKQRQEGVVIVGLVIDKAGEIVAHSIKRSSGHAALDQEVDNMLQRAGKMPALPSDYPRDQVELLIPIRFKVSR